MRRTAPTIRHALGMVAGTAIEQARELVVGYLDRWAERVCQRLEAPAGQSPVEPSESIERSQPVELSEPVERSQPVELSESVESTEPIEPAEPAAEAVTPLLISVATGAFIGAIAAWLLASSSSKA